MLTNNNFKYKATIDWMEFEICTLQDTNFYVIKHLFKTNFAEPINQKSGGAANTYRFRIHNLKSWQEFDTLYKWANYAQPISSIYIVGVEISFDAFSINKNNEELIEKTAEFFWLLQKPCSKNIRAAGQYKGSAEQLTGHQSTIRKIKNRMSIYIGSQKDDSVSQRIYYKTTDNLKALPLEKHSARYEITLFEDDCPFHTLEEAKKFNFSDLAAWFKFRKLKENQSIFSLLLTKANRQLGHINTPRLSGGGLKIGNCGTVADTQLNRIAYDKLRELSKRLGKSRVTRKLRVIGS